MVSEENTKIIIRMNVLKKIQEIIDKLDRDVHNKEERNAIKNELMEIKEIISSKDKCMEDLEKMDQSLNKSNPKIDSIKKWADVEVIEKILKKDYKDMVINQYLNGTELAQKELEEMITLIQNKEKFIFVEGKLHTTRPRGKNQYLSKYFKIDEDPEL